MKDRDHFRMPTNWHGWDWIAPLPWATRGIWPLVVEHVKIRGRGGECSAPILARFAGEFDIPIEAVEALVAAAISAKALIEEDGEWRIPRWYELYQEPDNTNATRQQRHRDRKRNAVPESNNGGVTESNTSVTPLREENNGGVTEDNGVTERYVTQAPAPPCPPSSPLHPSSPPISPSPSPANAGEKGASAENSTDKRESNAARLLRLLPESHRTEGVRTAIASYFRMRSEKRWGRLTDESITAQAKKYAEFEPSEIEEAFSVAVRSGHQGVFPKRRTEPPAKTKPTGGKSAKQLLQGRVTNV